MSGNALAMSDEEFLNAMPPAVVKEKSSQETVPEAVVAQEPVQREPVQPAAAEVTEEPTTTEDKQDTNPLATADGDISSTPPAEVVSDKAGTGSPEVVAASQGEAAAVSEADKVTAQVPAESTITAEAVETPAATEPVVDKAAEYDRLLAPIQANGRTIQLKNTDEVLRMVQMGANYTRKMQDIAPHRRVLSMLESNGLLDESKLSFLIDLDKRNPAAIKQLVKDSGIDPMDIDTSAESGYVPGSHQISDAEDNFRAVLDEVTSTDLGRETVQIIHKNWDQTSKQVLMDSPEVLTIIQQQRENGIYDTIVAEVDRQKTLGILPVHTPLLQAYKTVGDQLAASGGFQALVEKTETPTPPTQPVEAAPQPVQREPVATTVAAPKATVANDERALAAAPSNSTPTTAKALVNPLSLSDDEFMAQMNQRV